MEKLEIWDKVKQPPKDALKEIRGGRLKGMTDINPQWRLKVMTEIFGPCGTGWRYEIVRLWNELGAGEEKAAFALVDVFYKQGDEWSMAVPGIGGNALVAKESAGPRTNDEAYKMAVTDAISTALKALGVGADIYAGKWDGSKYNVPQDQIAPQPVNIGRVNKAVSFFIEEMDKDDWELAPKIQAAYAKLDNDEKLKVHELLDQKVPDAANPQKKYKSLLKDYLNYKDTA